MKGLMRALILVAAAGAPIVYFSASGLWKKAGDAVSSWTGGGAEDGGSPADLNSASRGNDGAAALAVAFEEVFRFDVTPAWVLSRWSQVTTGLADVELQGYRVSLVTGTEEDDLAGCLTYYFDPQDRLRRITFRGATGNARRLVGLLRSQFRFVRRITDNPGQMLFQGPSPDGKVTNQLRVRPVGMVRSELPRARYDVQLVLERPLPPMGRRAAMLPSDQPTNRPVPLPR